MNLRFEKVVMHNFLSIGDATINFDNCGYVKVQGRNECITDNSASNGSGKSSIFESIVYCLTGQTIRGTKDVVNVNGEDGCYVGLEFYVDNDHYKILRSKNHKKYKTDLKIYINDVDKSGKGISDGNKLLAEYLPDINYELLSSVIVLGQGLPQRFTNNTPSGRKDILENLAKSDVMINDLKARVAKRNTELNVAIREVEDSTLTLNSQIVVYQKQLENDKTTLATIDEVKTATAVAELTAKVARLKTEYEATTEKSNQLNTALGAKKDEATVLAESLNAKLATVRAGFPTEASICAKYPTYATVEKEFPTVEAIKAKYSTTTEIENKYSKQINDTQAEINRITTEIQVLTKDIETKSKITDICPTCGQKLPNVQKFDVEPLKKQVEELRASLATITAIHDKAVADCKVEVAENEKKINDEIDSVRKAIQDKFNASEATKNEECRVNRENLANAEQKVNDEFAEQKKKITEEFNQLKADYNTTKTSASTAETAYNTENQNLIKLIAYKESLATQRATLEANIKTAETTITDFSNKILYNNSEKEKLQEHLAVITKFDTELKRDFRTYLLTNVISFISDRAKEYSQEVFDTDKIIFEAEGNSIRIGYNGKEYECLSGGEKQKVDLIVQFAIRDMLCTFRNFSSNLIIVDEIFDNLDSKGCDKVVNLMATKLTDISSFFIVTHHTDIDIPYDAQITVVKSKEGISYIE